MVVVGWWMVVAGSATTIHHPTTTIQINAGSDEWPPASKEINEQERNADRREDPVAGDGCDRQAGSRGLCRPLRRHGRARDRLLQGRQRDRRLHAALGGVHGV